MRHGFVTNTLQPVLGKQFVEIGELVHVNESFLREVAVIAKTSRPSFRVRESDVDYAAPHALLFRNHCSQGRVWSFKSDIFYRSETQVRFH